MSGQHPPLTCSEFKAVLTKLGFVKRERKPGGGRGGGTSHEDWIGKSPDGRFCKVTVDCPKAPFTHNLIKWMARQAGVNSQTIYDIHFGAATRASDD
jgi:hypothetical protein